MNFGLILQNVSQLPSESRKILVQQSLKCPTKFPWILFRFIFKSQDIPESVSQHSHECCLVLFSHQISTHKLFALFFTQDCYVSVTYSYNIHGVWHINCIVNSQNLAVTEL